MTSPKQILAFCGSSRRGSVNQSMLDVVIAGARDAGASVTSVRLRDFQLPVYDGDLEAEHGMPFGGRELQALMGSHDALLIASPEHNGGYSAMLKNAIDWISRAREDGSPGVALFARKSAAIVSASPGQLGGFRSQAALRGVLEKVGMLVIPDSFALSFAPKAFNAEGKLLNAQVEKTLRGIGAALAQLPQ